MTENFYAVLMRRKELLLDELEKINYLLGQLPESRRKPESKTSQIIELAKAVIRQNNSYPVTTEQIMRRVIAEGINLGNNPAQNLSVTLSKAEEFENLRGRGWMLVDTPIHRELISEEEFMILSHEEELENMEELVA